MSSKNLALIRNPSPIEPFQCRLCKGYHALRKCQAFLKMNVEKRFRAVMLFDYCPNCLAHEHSDISCFNDTGCHICTKKHHTLLHSDGKIRTYREQGMTSRSGGIRRRENLPYRRSSVVSTLSATSSLFAHQKMSLLPTVTVVLITNQSRQPVRALIDVCSPFSKVDTQLSYKLKLKGYKLENEAFTQLTLTSKVEPQIRIQVDAKNTRLPMKTPLSTVNSSIINKFSHIMLADTKFYDSQGISLVLGNDICGKIFKTGVIPAENGLPLAQDTVFGWVLSGTISH